MAYNILCRRANAAHKLDVSAISEQWVNRRPARDEKDVEGGALGEGLVRDELKAALAGDHVLVNGDEGYLRIGQAREKLMRTSYIELREAREEDNADGELHVGGHTRAPQAQRLLHRGVGGSPTLPLVTQTERKLRRTWKTCGARLFGEGSFLRAPRRVRHHGARMESPTPA